MKKLTTALNNLPSTTLTLLAATLLALFIFSYAALFPAPVFAAGQPAEQAEPTDEVMDIASPGPQDHYLNANVFHSAGWSDLMISIRPKDEYDQV